MKRNIGWGWLGAVFFTLASCTELPPPLGPEQPSEALSPRVQALIDAGAPRLQIAVVATESVTLAFLESQREGVTVWLAPDESAVTLRNGVLISTSGLGEGLISAEVSEVLARLRQRSSGPVQRHHSYLNGNNETVQLRFTCQLAHQGRETIMIGEQSRPTDLMAERCQGEDISFTNFYWMAVSGPQILQSRQWAGPRVGYLATQAAR